MDLGSGDVSLQRALKGDLVDTGKRLLLLDASSDEVLSLLEKAESLLAKVWQHPPKSIRRALLPIMKALIADDLLHNHEINIQVAVASCFNELTRITAPDFTYPDDLMKVIFRLFMIAFEQLACKSDRNYPLALRILETMAKVKSSLMLMDIDSDGLIVEMFQLFFDNIRPNNQSDVFKYMEIIMSLVIEESDKLSVELLRPLLASVKMDNKVTSPISWELGKKVFENCAPKLRSYVQEAVKAMSLDLDDYSKIVNSICNAPGNMGQLMQMQMQRFPLTRPEKAKHMKNGKMSRSPPVEYAENLVNSRILVWWPMDEMFYPGKVEAFDSDTKKHVILYDDNEVEVLNLRKETWKLLVDEHPIQMQEADHPSPSKVPVKTAEKTTSKRKVNPSHKPNALASSKRSKIGNQRVVKSGENLAHNSTHVNKDIEDACRAIQQKDGVQDLKGKEEQR